MGNIAFIAHHFLFVVFKKCLENLIKLFGTSDCLSLISYRIQKLCTLNVVLYFEDPVEYLVRKGIVDRHRSDTIDQFCL